MSLKSKIINNSKCISDRICYNLSKIADRNKNLWIFGAWFGEKFTDNSKYFFLYILRHHPEIKPIWITNDDNVKKEVEDLGGICVRRNSFEAIKYIWKAGVIIFNQSIGDITSFPLVGNAVIVQLWHGMPLKKIAKDSVKHSKIVEKLIAIREFVFKEYSIYDCLVATSEETKKILGKAFQMDKNKVYISGQPRTDVFYQSTQDKIRKKLSIPRDKKIITYMPTFRNNDLSSFSFTKLNEIDEFLEKNNCVIIEKLHYMDYIKNKDSKKNTKWIFQALDYQLNDPQEILHETDLLITDYSSCFIDYLLLDKPILLFTYDLEYYLSEDRGFYYNIKDIAPGEIILKEDEILKTIEMNLKNPYRYSGKREDIRRIFHKYTDQRSSERVYNIINKLI